MVPERRWSATIWSTPWRLLILWNGGGPARPQRGNRADEMPERNPDWTRDELILALDVYVRVPEARGREAHPAVVALSEVLNRLPIHERGTRVDKFRNPNGVSMKLSNFLRYDPGYSGAGLRRGNKLEAEVWKEFSGDPGRLQRIASAIRESVSAPSIRLDLEETDEVEEAPEGRLLTRLHLVRERCPALVQAKKAKVLRETGCLRCEICLFDFERAYGEFGRGFAECHHTRPVSELRPGDKTRLADLAVVCANCHRMIHRRRPWLAVQELRDAVAAAADTR